MGKITGFLEFDRKIEEYAPVETRVKNYKEFTLPIKVPDVWIAVFHFAIVVVH